MAKLKLIATAKLRNDTFWLVEGDDLFYAVRNTEDKTPTKGIYASPCGDVAARHISNWDMEVKNKVIPMSVINRIHESKDNEALKRIIKQQKRIWARKTLHYNEDARNKVID